MAGETRRKFDADFREGAVRLVREKRSPVAVEQASRTRRDDSVPLSFAAAFSLNRAVATTRVLR